MKRRELAGGRGKEPGRMSEEGQNSCVKKKKKKKPEKSPRVLLDAMGRRFWV